MTGLELKIKRNRVGLRQYEVADQVGISPARLSEIELGRRNADAHLVAPIRQVIKANRRCRISHSRFEARNGQR